MLTQRGRALQRQVKPLRREKGYAHIPSRVYSLERRVVVRSRPEEDFQGVLLDFRGEAAHKAGARLQDLLSGVGDGEEELLKREFVEESPWNKTLQTTSAGGIVVVACAGVSLLCGNDPAGGAHFSVDSLGAGMVGMVAAIPVIGLRRYMWDSQASRRSPILQEMMGRRAEEMAPTIAGLSRPQQTAVILSDAVTILAVMLVALMGCIQSSLTLYLNMAEKSFGLDVPEMLPILVAVVVPSVLYGIGEFGGTYLSPDELSIVMDAINNSDRYYRVAAVGEGKNEDPELNSHVFKKVAQTWLSNNQSAALLSGTIGFFEILTLGILWQVTGDLTAPAVVAVLGSAADHIYAGNYNTAARIHR